MTEASYGKAYNGQSKSKRVTAASLKEMKRSGEKIVMLTAYDFPMARFLDEEGVDVILVGDSLGMVVQGRENTLSVKLEESLYHTELVARAAKRAMVIGDMPFMSYQISAGQAIANAGRYVQEAGAQAVKLEGGARVVKQISAIVEAQIPVLAHIGLTPQSINVFGGFKIQRDKDKLIEDALAVQSAGAFALILEGIPSDIAKSITEKISIPSIGIGAGANCDGQVLVLQDMLGLFDDFTPKFVKKYASLAEEVRNAIRGYSQDVRQSKFPGPEHGY